MAKSKVPQLLLKTPEDQLSKVERFKMESHGAIGTLPEEFRATGESDISAGAEQIAKSHGIYLEYNRAKTGREKDWMYMIRISVPGGGGFNREQWRILDEVSDKYTANPEGMASIRLTTRQNIQFHWVKKPDVLPLIQAIASTGFFTLNGCGDNTRNVMGCPLSKFSDIFDANALAHKYGHYFQLPAQSHIKVFAVDPTYFRADAEDPAGGKRYDYGPKLLNRKFKIAISALHRHEQTGEIERDNCVEALTNDLGIVPILDADENVSSFQVFIGGGQGEKNGKPTYATLGRPLGIFTEDNLLKGVESVVKVHEQWGDRKNRHWARLKYVVQAQGIGWFQNEIKAIGAEFDPPDPAIVPGPRCMHHGWINQPSNGKLARGVWIENGRVVDRDADIEAGHGSGSTRGNGEKLKSMVRHLMETYDTEVLITPNQDLLFTNLDPDAKEDFDADLEKFEYGTRRFGKPVSTLRVLSGACVGLPTCRLSYTDSEKFQYQLLDQLEEMGYGDMAESIGITGCERQCFRPATKTIGWVGQGPDMYMLKLGGKEDGSTQGTALVEDDKLYLRQVPREEVAVVTAVLFDDYNANATGDEKMGDYIRRLGPEGVLALLRDNEKTAPLLEKTHPAPYLPDGVMSLDRA